MATGPAGNTTEDATRLSGLWTSAKDPADIQQIRNHADFGMSLGEPDGPNVIRRVVVDKVHKRWYEKRGYWDDFEQTVYWQGEHGSWVYGEYQGPEEEIHEEIVEWRKNGRSVTRPGAGYLGPPKSTEGAVRDEERVDRA